MSSTATRRRRIVVGSTLIVAGLAVAVVLWIVAGSRRSSAIENLARAPIGCDTTLDFAETGEYLIFVETTGRLEDVRGDCDADGDYEITDLRPDVDITLLDPDGEQVDLRARRDDVTYSDNGFVGRSVLSVDITQPDDHVIRVEATDDASFAVAVGRDPGAGVGLLRVIGLVVGVTGLVLGVFLLLVRRRRTADDGAVSAATPGWHTTPPTPTQPPYRHPVPAGAPGPPDRPLPPPPPGQAGWTAGHPPGPNERGDSDPYGPPPGSWSLPVVDPYGPPPSPSEDPYGRPAAPSSPVDSSGPPHPSRGADPDDPPSGSSSADPYGPPPGSSPPGDDPLGTPSTSAPPADS